jgi:hypothetical protein
VQPAQGGKDGVQFRLVVKSSLQAGARRPVAELDQEAGEPVTPVRTQKALNYDTIFAGLPNSKPPESLSAAIVCSSTALQRILMSFPAEINIRSARHECIPRLANKGGKCGWMMSKRRQTTESSILGAGQAPFLCTQDSPFGSPVSRPLVSCFDN